MNWVGGSRSRIMLKQERRKQKEFFEKKKLKSKMNLLDVSGSPSKNSAISLDLLNLFVVNQISTKKNKLDTSIKAVHVDMNKVLKPVQRQNIELSLSPPSKPDKIYIDNTQNIGQQQSLKGNEISKRKLSERMSYLPLSPVLESSNIGSQKDYQYSETENCNNTYPSSSSMSWSPVYKYCIKENDTAHLCSPRNLPYEDEQENQIPPFSNPDNDTIENSWLCIPENMDCTDRKTDIIQFGKLCEQSNCSLENANFIDKTHIMNIGKEYGSRQGKEEPSFAFLNERPQPVFNLLEGTHLEINEPLEDDDAIKKNAGNQPFVENKYRIQNNRSILQSNLTEVDSSSSNHNKGNADRCLKSIFTLPTQTFSNSNNVLRNCFESEQSENNISKQNNAPHTSLFTVSFEKENSIFSLSVSDTECPFSSPSPSYSPRETDSCFSASSEMRSEDEDTENQEVENLPIEENIIDARPQNRISHQDAYLHLRRENREAQEDKWTIHSAPQDYFSRATFYRNADNTEKHGKSDAWAQTEAYITFVEKCDAAIQCDDEKTPRKYSICCTPKHSASNIVTTRGQQTPKDGTFKPVNINEASYQTGIDLTLYETTALDVLNYINLNESETVYHGKKEHL